jgi:cell division protein FtsW
MIFSASNVSTVLRYHVSVYHFFIRQAVFLILGLLAGIIVILRLPTSRYRHFAIPIVIVVMSALVGLFMYGQMTNNAQSWYDFGPVSLQPSEFAKTAIIIFMASFYDVVARKKNVPITLYFIPLAVAGIFAVLVIMQPDLGSALIILLITFAIFISVPGVKRNIAKISKYLLIGAGIFAIALLVGGKEILNSRQMKRFEFKNPCSRYREETGYQVCNGFIAIHNGGLLGKGLGNSTQKYLYLPESHTDFIFPIIVEELGLIVGILIVLGYAIMLYRILVIARKSSTLNGAILAYGAFIYILTHILINLLGILAIIPLTGVPLPLLSYGGSFTINIMVMLFIVQRVAIENNNNEIKQTIAKISK